MCKLREVTLQFTDANTPRASVVMRIGPISGRNGQRNFYFGEAPSRWVMLNYAGKYCEYGEYCDTGDA